MERRTKPPGSQGCQSLQRHVTPCPRHHHTGLETTSKLFRNKGGGTSVRPQIQKKLAKRPLLHLSPVTEALHPYSTPHAVLTVLKVLTFSGTALATWCLGPEASMTWPRWPRPTLTASSLAPTAWPGWPGSTGCPGRPSRTMSPAAPLYRPSTGS